MSHGEIRPLYCVTLVTVFIVAIERVLDYCGCLNVCALYGEILMFGFMLMPNNV